MGHDELKKALADVVSKAGIYATLGALAEVMEDKAKDEKDPRRSNAANQVAEHIRDARDR